MNRVNWILAGLMTAVLLLTLSACATVTPEESREGEFVIGWNDGAEDWRGEIGKRLTFELEPGGEAHPVWGTDLYTDESSIGTSAVHAGVITFETGGMVTIEIRAGRSSFTGSRRNGVTSEDHDTWCGSFVILD